MAEEQYKNEGVFQRLSKLFRSNIVVRKTDGGQLKVKDVDFTQTGLTSNFIDRFSRLHNSSWGTKYASKQNARNNYDVARRELYRDYEIMDQDPIISSALDIYSDESTVSNVEGQILKVKTDNPKITKILNNLFYDIMNIEFNLWSWIRNLTKYGDFFLKLSIVDKYGIVNCKPISAYDIVRLEDHDPSDPTLVQFEIYNDESGPNKETVLLENYEVAHFRMISDANLLPYGKAQLEGARRIWKQLTLMEDAMLIHRIMRAPEKRIFKVDIGNIPPNEVDNFMQQIINKMKKIPVIDQNTGDYNLKYNVESITEDYFLPVRGGDSGTSIDTLSSLEYNAIDDIEYLRNKMMAALKVPKAFLGYEEGVGSKATLAAEDVRFSRTIERIQKLLCAELEKIAIIHLYTQGIEDADLINFELELTNPSMIHEQEKLELLNQQVDISNNILENKLLSRKWIWDNIFDFDTHEQKEMFGEMVEDQKQKFRFTQIEDEGNDPVESGKTAEDEEELEMARKEMWGGDRRTGDGEKEYDTGAKSKDLKDATKYEKERYGKRNFKHKSPLHPGKGATLVRAEGLIDQLKKQYGKIDKNQSILSENTLIDEENNE